MDSFLPIIVIVLLSALSNWLSKKKGQGEDFPDINPAPPPPKGGTAPPLPRTPPASRPSPTNPPGWSEELRRMLEEAQQQQRRRPQAPPPLTGSQRPPKVPRQGQTSASPSPLRPVKPAPPPPLVPVPESSEGEDIKNRMAKMQESIAAFSRGRSLEQSVAERMRRVDSQTTQHRPSQPSIRSNSAELAQVVALVKKPRTARQAMALSVILGPPKALES